MIFTAFMTGIPLLLSFPTVLMSSLLTAQIAKDQHEKHEVLIHGLIPLFQALIAYLIFNSIVLRTLKNEIQRWNILGLLLCTFCMNSYVGPIQSSVLILLMIFHTTGMIENLSLLYIAPGFLISLAIKYVDDQKFTDVAFTFGIFALVWYGASKPSIIEKLSKKLSFTKTVALLFITNSIAIMGYLYLKSPVFILQNSMGVVFIGSMLLFVISFQYLYDELRKNVIHNASNTDYKIRPHYIIGMVGFITIAMQSLSFELEGYYFISLLMAYVVYNTLAVRPYYFKFSPENKNLKLKNDEKVPANKSLEHDDHVYDDNKSMFLQLAMTKETRSIFSFLLLNTSFMFVQLLYSFRSKSLGLLSDSLHMALDCTSLFLGLCAGVLAKKPANAKFPLGLKYLETLAGFANGVLLIGIVCGIFVEAVERIFTKTVVIRDTTELLIVSILGLLVNLVGLVAFDHGHAGGCDGHSDNMRGIFLHILADTLGSVGVIISTILTKIFNNALFDPIASVLIALLILVSSIPLIESSSLPLLLKLDDKHHNLVKEALNRIQSTPGIVSYTTPRFWQNTVDVVHAHAHSHGPANHHEHSHKEEACTHGSNENCKTEKHEHDHGHDHDHEHGHEHNNDHGHSHEHSNDHGHEQPTCVEQHHSNETPISASAKLCGYIHVQYREGENSVIIKKRCEKIFQDNQIDAYIQIESQYSECWCR